MANKKLSILKFLEQSYDIDALYLGGVAADKFARRDTDNSFTGKNTFSAGAKISGRFLGAGDDEGLVIGKADNSYAGVCLGEPAGIRSVFYLKPDNSALWRYNNGTSSFDIYHPAKNGTIALTSDVPTKVSQLANDSGYGTVAKVDNVSPSSGNVSLSAVRFVSQTLTDAQKTQARTNIGAASTKHTHRDSDILLYSSPQATSPYSDLNEWIQYWQGEVETSVSLTTSYLNAGEMFQPHYHKSSDIALFNSAGAPDSDLQTFYQETQAFIANSGGGGGGGSSYTTLDRDFYFDPSDWRFHYADSRALISRNYIAYRGGWDEGLEVAVGNLMEWMRRDVFNIPPVITNSIPQYGSNQIAARGRCLFPGEEGSTEFGDYSSESCIDTIRACGLNEPFHNWDSMVVECLGGPGSAAECTMTIDFYTRSARHYRLQVACTNPGGGEGSHYITRGFELMVSESDVADLITDQVNNIVFENMPHEFLAAYLLIDDYGYMRTLATMGGNAGEVASYRIVLEPYSYASNVRYMIACEHAVSVMTTGGLRAIENSDGTYSLQFRIFDPTENAYGVIITDGYTTLKLSITLSGDGFID